MLTPLDLACLLIMQFIGPFSCEHKDSSQSERIQVTREVGKTRRLFRRHVTARSDLDSSRGITECIDYRLSNFFDRTEVNQKREVVPPSKNDVLWLNVSVN